MKIISIQFPELYLKELDILVKRNYYPNRAEAIRTAVRDLIITEGSEKRRLSL